MKFKTLFLFLLITLVAISCKKDDDQEEPSAEVGYFQADINGSQIVIEESCDSIFSHEHSGGHRGDTLDSTIIALTSTIGPLVYPSPNPPVKNHISIEVIYKFENNDLTAAKYLPELQFRDLVKIRSHPFSFLPFYKSGVRIAYNDHNGVRWISSKYFSLHGFGGDSIPITPNYSKFNFEIIESTQAPPQNFNKWRQEVKIKFNCNLYNSDGDSIKMENAEYKGAFTCYSE